MPNSQDPDGPSGGNGRDRLESTSDDGFGRAQARVRMVISRRLRWGALVAAVALVVVLVVAAGVESAVSSRPSSGGAARLPATTSVARTTTPGPVRVSVSSSTGCVSGLEIITDGPSGITDNDVGSILDGCKLRTPWVHQYPGTDSQVSVTVFAGGTNGTVGCVVAGPGQAPDRESASGADNSAQCSYLAT